MVSEREYVPVHIGVLGHIDSGKTEIARVLSEIVSTAGLDKHRQSRERGVTIDLGFTFFPLGNFMVTLVDAPGHADLIKSVVSCASIIDLAILVVDAEKGPQVQTGEHLIILDLFKIPFLVVLVNKIDLVSSSSLKEIEKKVRTVVDSTRFKDHYALFYVSAKEKKGFDAVKSFLLDYFNHHPPKRDRTSILEFPIDHYFLKKGQGSIVTGTVLRGEACVGDKVVILPPFLETRIKSIQHWKESTNKMCAGDRCGVLVPGVAPRLLYRGCFLTTNPHAFGEFKIFLCKIYEVPLFRHRGNFGQQISVTFRMLTVNGRLFPIKKVSGDKNHSLSSFFLRTDLSPSEKEYYAIIWLERGLFVPKEFRDHTLSFLLSRLDLPPKVLRILGSAELLEAYDAPPDLYRIRIKRGRVKKAYYTEKSSIVEGLSSSLIGAETLVGLYAEPPFGKIISTFGKKGNVIIEHERGSSIREGDLVTLRFYRKIPFDYNRSYK